MAFKDVFCEDEKSIEEEKYGVKYASDCEGKFNIHCCCSIINPNHSFLTSKQFVNILQLN